MAQYRVTRGVVIAGTGCKPGDVVDMEPNDAQLLLHSGQITENDVVDRAVSKGSDAKPATKKPTAKAKKG